MSTTVKLLTVVVFVAVSAALGVLAAGRRRAWPLDKWNCEPDPLPPIPGIADSFLSAGVVDWFFSVGMPLAFGLIFLVASRSRLSLLFWIPVLALHWVIRSGTFTEASTPWGVCGLRDGGYGGIVEFVLLGWTVILVGVTAVVRWLFRLVKKKP